MTALELRLRMITSLCEVANNKVTITQSALDSFERVIDHAIADGLRKAVELELIAEQIKARELFGQ